jgi:hypothetical protein
LGCSLGTRVSSEGGGEERAWVVTMVGIAVVGTDVKMLGDPPPVGYPVRPVIVVDKGARVEGVVVGA